MCDDELSPHDIAIFVADLGDGVRCEHQHQKLESLQKHLGFIDEDGLTDLFYMMYHFDEHDHSVEDLKKLRGDDVPPLEDWVRYDSY